MMPAALVLCSPGMPLWKAAPISNNWKSEKPRAVLRDAAASSEGSSEGRRASRSAAMGLDNWRASSPPPNSLAWSRAMKEKLTHSLKPRAAKVRRTVRARRWAEVRTGLATAAARVSGTEGTSARPWMRTTSSTRSAGPSMSRRQLGGVTCKVSCGRTVKPKAVRMATIFARRHADTAQRFDQTGIEFDMLVRRRQGARDHHIGRLAAAPIQNQLGGKLQPRQHEFRIDATLETIARIGNDALLAAGAGDAGGIEPGGFNKDVLGFIRAAGILAAHHPGNAARETVIGDDDGFVVQHIGLAVQRQHLFVIVRHAGVQIAGEFIGIEDMQRAAAILGDQVGGIDQRRNGFHAHAFQPVLHPFGRGAVLDAANEAAGENGAGVLVALDEIEADFFWAGNLPATGCTFSVFSVPRPAAARSRAMPQTLAASPRLGVMETSIKESVDKSPRAAQARPRRDCQSAASFRVR